MNKITVAILALSGSIALADDFKTVDGKEYKNVTVTNQDPCSVTVSDKKAGRILRFYLTELVPELQQRFRYDASKCNEYLATQNSASEEAKKQRRNYDEGQKKLWKEEQWHRWIKDLQDRYESLGQQENDLVQQIAKLEAFPEFLYQSLGYHRGSYRYPNPVRKDLPLLENNLKDVRHQKDQVEKELEQAKQNHHLL